MSLSFSSITLHAANSVTDTPSHCMLRCALFSADIERFDFMHFRITDILRDCWEYSCNKLFRYVIWIVVTLCLWHTFISTSSALECRDVGVVFVYICVKVS